MNGSENLISVLQFCQSHGIEVTFITTLSESGLIEVIREGDTLFVHIEKIPRLEKIVRLHFDLHINLEGIEAISHLLERVETQQLEIIALRNELRRLR